jgi:translation elongation factor EF-4
VTQDREVDLVCINVLLNKEPVDAFSVLVPRMKAHTHTYTHTHTHTQHITHTQR